MRKFITSLLVVSGVAGAFAIGRISSDASVGAAPGSVESATASAVVRDEAPAARRAAAPRAERAPDLKTAAPAAGPLAIEAGTELPLVVETSASSETSAVGDLISARLEEPVSVRGGVVPAGAEVRGRVTAVASAKRFRGEARLAVLFDTLVHDGRRVAIDTRPVDSSARSTKSKDKKIVGGTAAAGLIVGAIKDGVKGAVVGATAGAAAGMGAVMIMKGDDVVLPRGAKVRVAVEETASLRLSASR